MGLVMIIGVAYRQLQRHRNLTIASLLRYQAQPISDILKAAIIGEAHPGNIETRIVRMVPTILLHQSTTTSRCHPQLILNLDDQAIHGDLPNTSHIFPALSQP
jgi:hypothetical protein